MLGGKPGHKGSGVPGKRVGYMPQVKNNSNKHLQQYSQIILVILN